MRGLGWVRLHKALALYLSVEYQLALAMEGVQDHPETGLRLRRWRIDMPLHDNDSTMASDGRSIWIPLAKVIDSDARQWLGICRR